MSLSLADACPSFHTLLWSGTLYPALSSPTSCCRVEPWRARHSLFSRMKTGQELSFPADWLQHLPLPAFLSSLLVLCSSGLPSTSFSPPPPRVLILQSSEHFQYFQRLWLGPTIPFHSFQTACTFVNWAHTLYKWMFLKIPLFLSHPPTQLHALVFSFFFRNEQILLSLWLFHFLRFHRFQGKVTLSGPGFMRQGLGSHGQLLSLKDGSQLSLFTINRDSH